MIRFKSILHPNEFGYEYTGDSMTFWDVGYHSRSPIMHGACGYYKTLGDGDTQHTPLMAVGAEHFTDWLLSFARHCLANAEDLKSIHGYQLDVTDFSEGYMVFLVNIQYREDKKQWFSKTQEKVTTSSSKQHDKRWIEVPTWANGTLESAITLHYFHGENEYKFPRNLLERYMAQYQFEEKLYAKCPNGQGGDRWDKMIAYRTEIAGDHQAAVRAFMHLMKAKDALRHTQQLVDCGEHNSRNTMAEAA